MSIKAAWRTHPGALFVGVQGRCAVKLPLGIVWFIGVSDARFLGKACVVLQRFSEQIDII
jgi:hypothetical protein